MESCYWIWQSLAHRTVSIDSWVGGNTIRDPITKSDHAYAERSDFLCDVNLHPDYTEPIIQEMDVRKAFSAIGENT